MSLFGRMQAIRWGVLALCVAGCATRRPEAMIPLAPVAGSVIWRLEEGDLIKTRIYGQAELTGEPIVTTNGTRALAKFAQAHAESREHGQIFAEKIGVTRRQFDGLRQQQSLRRCVAVFHALEHLLVENSLVRGVLIEQHEPAIRFEHNV